MEISPIIERKCHKEFSFRLSCVTVEQKRVKNYIQIHVDDSVDDSR